MKILVLGTIDNKGGAAKISWELRKRLKADGHTVSTYVRYKYSHEPDVFVIPRKRWQDWLVKLFANDLTFSNTKYIFDTKEYREADIIHCHNLHSNFFNLKSLIRMSQEKIVIWTIHDLWAITGFANDSATRNNPNKKKFLLYLWDNTANLLRIKKSIYERSKLYIVTVSEWLKNQVENSILGSQDIRRIYNGIDTATFIPYDKRTIRRDLGLPLDKKIVAFSIKGWTDSQVIANHYVGQNDIFFLAIGQTTMKTTNTNYCSIPYIVEKESIAKYLSASDIFLYPTHGDTFGLIAAEAMACGTPVVAYDTDALPEIVTHKNTGYVAKYSDTEDLIVGIDYILNLSDESYKIMSQKARQRIIDHYTLDKMYTEYLNLYRELINVKTASPLAQHTKD